MRVPPSGLYPDLSQYNIDGSPYLIDTDDNGFDPAKLKQPFTAKDRKVLQELFAQIKDDGIFQKLQKKEEATRVRDYYTPVVEDEDKRWYQQPTYSNYSSCYHTCYSHSFTIISLGGSSSSTRHEVRSSKKEDEGMSRGTQVALAIVAAVVVSASIYLIGKAFAQIANAKDRIDIVKDYKGKINNCSTNLDQTTLDDTIKGIFKNQVFSRYTKFLDLAKKVEKSEIRSNQWKIALLVTAAAGAVILAIGAVAASWPLSLVGMGVVAVGGLGLLAKWSYESALGNERQERKIQKQLNKIQQGEAEIEDAFARWEAQFESLTAFNPDLVAPTAPPEEKDPSERGDYDEFVDYFSQE